MIVIVCGGRDYQDRELVYEKLDLMHATNPIHVIFHGGARGADTLAREWARKNRILDVEFKADWNKYRKAAGPIRNQAMLKEGKPHLVIAFPGGKGTANMVAQAIAANVPVWRIEHEGHPPQINTGPSR